MTKPDWKTKPHERVRMTLQQENQMLKERITQFKGELDDYRHIALAAQDMSEEVKKNAERYRALYDKDVMVLDGEPKYLKGEDLDKYCDEENSKFWGVSLTGMMANLNKTINSSNPVSVQPTKILINPSMLAAAQKILIEKERNGNDTGSKSEEANQKDTGHHTDILRYADWYGLWKQRRA
jgi:hypothetical protein